jgi:hypothetical protein
MFSSLLVTHAHEAISGIVWVIIVILIVLILFGYVWRRRA